jgi:hypothetical protein
VMPMTTSGVASEADSWSVPWGVCEGWLFMTAN